MNKTVVAGALVMAAALVQASPLGEQGPVRPGGVNGQPYWTVRSEQFVYPPAFDFAAVKGARNYRFSAVDPKGREYAFVAEKPGAALTPIWKNLPENVRVKLTVQGIDANGRAVGVAGEREFWRMAEFHPEQYPAAKRSYAEAAKMVYDYLFNLKSTQYFLKNGKPDPEYGLNAYPSKMHSALIRLMVEYVKIRPERKAEAVKLAKIAADYLISVSQPKGTPLEYFPPTYDNPKEGPGLGGVGPQSQGKNMLLYPALVGDAYLKLYGVTKEKKYLESATRIADTYLKIQGADGTCFLKVDQTTGEPVNANRAFPLDICTFLTALADVTGEKKYLESADRGLDYIRRGPMVSWNWEGQFEDVEPSKPYLNLTKHPPCDMAIYLLNREGAKPETIQFAADVLRFAEDQFVCWRPPCDENGNGMRGGGYKCWRTPSALEQYECYVPIDASSDKLVLAYLAYWKVTKDPLALAKARALADVLVNEQEDDGRIATWFNTEGPAYRLADWFNCTGRTAATLAAIAEAVASIPADQQSAQVVKQPDVRKVKPDYRARIAKTADDVSWIDGAELPLEGRAFDDAESRYDRLPRSAKSEVRDIVWQLSHHAAGLAFRFKTDSKKLRLKWVVGDAGLGDHHFCPTGKSGIDVYERTEKGWHHVKAGCVYNVANTMECDWTPGREALVFLPNYNSVKEFSLGIDEGTSVTAPGPRTSGATKPVVIYGSSITQGACASRSGMAFVNIANRLADVEMVNLGFSGNGWMESEMRDIINTIDASCYVIDSAWNIGSKEVAERWEPFVRVINEKHPETPIIFMEPCHESPLADKRRCSEIIRACYEKLVMEDPKKWSKLYLLKYDEQMPTDDETTVEGVHPNDWGMMHIGRALAEKIREALGI